jgi:DNA-binding protein YbaB
MTWPAADGPSSGLDKAIETFPERLAATTARVSEVATQTVVGTCAEDGRISVTVTGAGQVVDVHITPEALRELDRVTLGGYLVEATNRALDQADELLASAAESTAGDIDAVMDRFARRMDALLVDLERISSNLDAIRTS